MMAESSRNSGTNITATARQQCSKHISVAMNKHTENRGILGSSVFYTVHAEVI
jgi:hypothetical protein